ncbi:MAG: MarR family transcriptional regulator, partial [Mycobacteriales bacterium]
LLQRALRAVNADIVGRLADLGYAQVRPSHWAVFAGLEPGGSRVVDLANRAQMTRQGMSVLVKEREQFGYVTVGPDPLDGRAARVRLTKKGEAFCHQAARVVTTVEIEWRDLLGQRAWPPCARALHTLADHTHQ